MDFPSVRPEGMGRPFDQAGEEAIDGVADAEEDGGEEEDDGEEDEEEE